MPIEGSTALRAVALVCSLKPSPAASSSALIAQHVFEGMRDVGVECESIRCVDYALSAGVEADMGYGDEWPRLRDKILGADILVLATPTWLGHMSSVAQRVLERLDAELSNTDDVGRPALTGKVAVVAVVGNEDGAHKVTADLFQALKDVGYSIAAQASTYWNGEAMQKTDYLELDKVPDAVASATVLRHATPSTSRACCARPVIRPTNECRPGESSP